MYGAPGCRSARRSRGSRSIDSSSCLWFASRATYGGKSQAIKRPEGTGEGICVAEGRVRAAR